MQTAKPRSRALIRIVGCALAGAAVGGLIGWSTADPVLFWVWLTVTAALGSVIGAAPSIAGGPTAD